VSTKAAWCIVVLSPVLVYYTVRGLSDIDHFKSRGIVYKGTEAVVWNVGLTTFTVVVLVAAVRKIAASRRDPDWKKIDE
jgi:hypothetical protein